MMKFSVIAAAAITCLLPFNSEAKSDWENNQARDVDALLHTADAPSVTFGCEPMSTWPSLIVVTAAKGHQSLSIVNFPNKNKPPPRPQYELTSAKWEILTNEEQIELGYPRPYPNVFLNREQQLLFQFWGESKFDRAFLIRLHNGKIPKYGETESKYIERVSFYCTHSYKIKFLK